MKIYLTDLTHDNGLRLRAVPLGIGTLACALKDNYGDKVKTELFVYPQKIIAKLKSDPPDILALSNYIWNSKLGIKIAKIAKKINPKILTVMGGPHCRMDQEGLKSFVSKNPSIDVYIPYEGEAPFAELIGKCLEKKTCDIKKLGQVDGCFLDVEGYKFNRLLVKSDKTKKAYDSPYYTINRYTSPYTSGVLDEFLADPKLSPMLESNRGCPYSCTFCAWGIGSGNKLIKKDMHKFIEEIWYVGKKTNNDSWFLADANFGMVKEDITIAKTLKEINKKHGVPQTFHYHTAKNTAKLVFEVSEILGDSLPINIAVQSFDPEVLKKIKRKNLKNEEIVEFVKTHQQNGRQTETDLLVPQSGESRDSHLNSIRKAFEIGFDAINTNIIRMLPGTEMESDKDRETYGFKTLWRPMDSGFGVYDGEFIFETDESIIASKDITEEEMYGIKSIHFLTVLFWMTGAGKPLLKLALKNNINPVDLMLLLTKDKTNPLTKNILAPLEEEYRNEWFKTEEDLIEHYSKPEVYEKLISGENEMAKLNLIYLARIMAKPEVLHECISGMKDFIQKTLDIDKNIVETVYKISLDNLKLDPMCDKLKKKVNYKVSRETFEYLKSINVISKNIKYDGQGFSLDFEFSNKTYKTMKAELIRLDYKENKTAAIYGSVTLGVAKFLYSLRTDDIIYNFAKNPFQRPEESEMKASSFHH